MFEGILKALNSNRKKIFIDLQSAIILNSRFEIIGTSINSARNPFKFLEDFKDKKDTEYNLEMKVNDLYETYTENNLVYLANKKNKNYFTAEENALIFIKRNKLKARYLVVNFVDFDSTILKLLPFFGITRIYSMNEDDYKKNNYNYNVIIYNIKELKKHETN